MAECTHLDQVRVTQLPESTPGCEDCLAVAESGHPLIRSIEPREDWSWCFLDEIGMVIPEVRGETRIPPSPLGG